MAKSRNFLPKPVYRGGQRAMNAFLKANIKYPEAAKAAKIEGTVRVNYSLDQSGRVVKVQAVDGPKEGGLRQEAERVVKLLKFEIPKERKMRIQYHQHIDIHFKLPKPKAKPKSQSTSPTGMRYTLTKAKSEPERKIDEVGPAPEEQKKAVYTYTIRW
ncbi:MAG: TonB family protein [Bacteroidota bacterium]